MNIATDQPRLKSAIGPVAALTFGRQRRGWNPLTVKLAAICLFVFLSATTLLPAPITFAQMSNEKLLAWKERQAMVRQVVENVTPAVVAISDGESFGSGVIVSKDGLILTAGHVIIEDDREFVILFPDGRSVAAKPLGKNLNQDAGMMKISQQGDWPYVDLADDGKVRRGDWVVTLGHSGGYDLGRKPPVRLGRILRIEREAYTSDSPIIGGDSGGPLFNLDGQLIGIHSSIGESIAENRHVSIGTFLRDWDRMESGESWGALPGTEEPPKRDKEDSPKESSNEGTAALGVEVDRNDKEAILRKIKPNSAAARVGLKEGDVVVSFNGVAIGSPASLVRLISSKRSGDSVKVIVRRGSEQLEYQIILGQLQTN